MNEFVGISPELFEERYQVHHSGQWHDVYASDHLPVVADLVLPVDARRMRSRPRRSAASAYAAGGTPTTSSALSIRAVVCIVLLTALILALVAVLGAMVWDMAGGGDLQCRVECRNKKIDPPFVDERPLNMSCDKVT